MKTIILSFLTIITNIALGFTLILVLADGILPYKTGFYVLAPILLGLTAFVFHFLYRQTILRKKELISEFNYICTIIFVLINAFIFFFNYACWIDLFDGRTNTLLP